MEETKFKANPYNPNNILISEKDILNIMENLNIHDFKCNNLSLYQRAFIHKSYTKLKDYDEFTNDTQSLDLFDISYETLEFVGDAFLGNIIANYLYHRYFHSHNMDEGFLTKLKIRFVCGEQLAYLSKCIGFDKYMIISKHIEDNCDGRSNTNILEDIFEAFLGAIYEDTKDFKFVEKFIIKVIEKYIDFSETILYDNNYKDQILRYFQHNYRVYPTYKTEKNENNKYECKLYKGDDYIITGYGNSKKKSEQDASKRALIKYHVLSE